MTHRFKWLSRASLLVACALFFAAPAAAQFDRAQLSGRVKDSTGGAVPGATITATNTQTQDRLGRGHRRHRLLHVPEPARRRATTCRRELQGFKKSLRSDVQLDAAGSLTLDFTLETGAVTEEVTVTAESPVLQTDTALRKTIESKDIEQLSFSGRNPIGVVGLKAGRRRRQLQQLQLLRPRQRRLQHQRQPQRREQHHGRRRDRDPHPVARARSSASRTSTRSRKSRC